MTVPIYVTIAHFGNGATTFIVDEKRIGRAGNAAGGYFTETYVVPSGSSYKLSLYTGTVTLDTWNEARMPVAIAVGEASGGEAQPPVAFNATITTGQQYDSETTNQLKYLSATVDTDSGLTDDSYVVPKDGLYSFSGGIYYSAPNGVKILTGAGTSLSFKWRNYKNRIFTNKTRWSKYIHCNS